MRKIETPIPGVFVLEPKVFGDHRGFFLEAWNRRTFADLGLNYDFVQDNHSRSRKNVLRGLHFQIQRPQAKLVRALSGRVWDVVVDIRRGSPSFGRYFGAELSAENRRMLMAPRGMAHGFVVLSDFAEFHYKVDDYYAPEDEGSILYSDPKIGIRWPVDEGFEPILSEKDASSPPLEDIDENLLPIFDPTGGA